MLNLKYYNKTIFIIKRIKMKSIILAFIAFIAIVPSVLLAQTANYTLSGKIGKLF